MKLNNNIIDIELFDKDYVLKNYKDILLIINKHLNQLSEIDDIKKQQEFRLKVIYILKKFIDNIDLKVYMLIGTVKVIPEHIFYECIFTLGTLYKLYVEIELQNTKKLNKELQNFYITGLNYFLTILQFKINDNNTLSQISSIYSYLTLYSEDKKQGLQYMLDALLYDSLNPLIHYNLGFLYFHFSDYKNANIHFKISIGILENKLKYEILSKTDTNLIIQDYYQIVLINRLIKNFPECLHYLLKAIKIDPNDPDINNQLGLVYTEFRRTDLAKNCYLNGIKYYKNTIISSNCNELLSDLYINYGHMSAYNGEIKESIIKYNKALEIRPNYYITFNNKSLNLTYLFNEYKDKMYITNEHKLVNNVYPKYNNYKFNKELFNSSIINIGIISGDFINHPVSYFISTILNNYNINKFQIYCYSESSVYESNVYNKQINYISIQNKITKEVSDLIYNHKIHILFDLAGHSAYNRLDVFAFKPAPIQISYIGYPFTTGLNEIDYRITDEICEVNLSKAQKYYTEKLITLPNCFLCYDPISYNYYNNTDKIYKIPNIESNFISNDIIYIGCFNRLNKINDTLINIITDILLKFNNINFVFKTKALMNKDIKLKFLNKFNKKLHNKIIILDCTISHDEHLLIYNQIHFALDSFPYSGTTTTCEALYMGVPVISFYDNISNYHPHNVSCSILKNSNLEEYIINIEKDNLLLKKKINEKITNILNNQKNNNDWLKLKNKVRNKFLNGYVCNKKQYMKNIEKLLTNLYNEYKSKLN